MNKQADKTTSINWAVWLNRLGPLLGLVLVYGLFVILTRAEGIENFTSLGNLETIARQTTVVGTAALGMTLVIISGGIDLSVGSIIALGTVAIAALLEAQLHPLLALAGGIGLCAAFGLVNGLVITRLRVVPFIVTLGSMQVVRGVAKGLADEQKIDVENLPLWIMDLCATLPPGQRWMLFPPGVWLMLAAALATGGLLLFTRFGRHVFALGSSEETARLCGVATDRVKVMVYTLAGLLGGLAGLMQFSRLTVGDPTVAQGAELDVIAAVVIGGGSLAGGEGSVLGSVVGALIMTVIRNGCSQLGVDNWVQEIITGGIIIVAVALDRLRHRRAT